MNRDALAGPWALEIAQHADNIEFEKENVRIFKRAILARPDSPLVPELEQSIIEAKRTIRDEELRLAEYRRKHFEWLREHEALTV